MSNTESIPSVIDHMVDVDLERDFDGARTSVTVYNARQSDYDLIDDLIVQGYRVVCQQEVM